MAMITMANRKVRLTEAFETFALGDERVMVQTMEGVVVNINTSVLLFSPFLRDVLLLGLQRPSETLLILPSVSLSALLAIANLLTTGLTNVDVSLIELVSVASELGITGFSLEGLQDTSDTSSVSTVGNQDANNIQEDISALATEIRREECLPENVSVTPEQIIANCGDDDGRKRKVSGMQATPGPAGQSEAGSIGQQHHDEQWVGPPAKRQAPQVSVMNTPLRCLVTNAKCTEQGKQFRTAYDLRYHYSKHARAALLNRLTEKWANFVNDTNSCSQCDVLFQSQDKLAFHIGAKHNEVEAILKTKGIPIPKDLPSDPNQRPIENLETPSTVPGPRTSAALTSVPVPDPRSPPGHGTAPEPGNEQAASAPGPGHSAAGPGNVAKGGGWTCAGVNYELNCQVCEAPSPTLTQLIQHCTHHFTRNIQVRFAALIGKTDKDCQVCGNIFKTKSLLVHHIGTKHGKVNDVLVELGYKALPCPVARDTKRDPEIQRKIMELKQERQREQEETASSPQQQQQSNNHVSFGPEFVRHIPPRSNKF